MLLASRPVASLIAAASFVSFVALSSTSSLAQSGPFAGLDGAWNGTGTVTLADGNSERIRCRATYRVGGGGAALQQTLRCASDSYKFDLSSDVTSSGDRVTGSWAEASRGVNGSVSGSARAGQINVLVEAAGFAANLQVATRGSKQSVTMTSKGEIKSVNITMSKG